MSRHDPALLQDLEAALHAVADIARPETLRFFRTPALAIANKLAEGFDPVTEGDRAAETAMRAALADLRPDDAILGEEFGTTPGQSGLTWVIDPIDGTRAYLAGAPTWGVLIAVSDADGPIMGLIDQPHIGERFFGGPDAAWVAGPRGRVPLSCRPARPLAEAILFTTFPEVGTAAEQRAFAAVSKQARLTRYGLDCYAYGLVAAGQADLVIEANLQAYDIQGPMAVVQAAAGVVTDWQGGPA
ncbi:hypothetical protein LCGC14_2591300, partial [marine sediment metagenome]